MDPSTWCLGASLFFFLSFPTKGSESRGHFETIFPPVHRAGGHHQVASLAAHGGLRVTAPPFWWVLQVRHAPRHVVLTHLTTLRSGLRALERQWEAAQWCGVAAASAAVACTSATQPAARKRGRARRLHRCPLDAPSATATSTQAAAGTSPSGCAAAVPTTTARAATPAVAAWTELHVCRLLRYLFFFFLGIFSNQRVRSRDLGHTPGRWWRIAPWSARSASWRGASCMGTCASAPSCDTSIRGQLQHSSARMPAAQAHLRHSAISASPAQLQCRSSPGCVPSGLPSRAMQLLWP